MLKNKIKSKKIVIIGCTMILFSMLLAGCSGKKNANGSMKAEDGRSYGGLIKAVMKEKVSTAFFDVTIEDAAKYNTYQFEDGLYQADAGNTYLVVTLTIKNTYEKDLPMSITDFTLDFKGNGKENVISGYGKTDLTQDNFMENIFTLKRGESITKSILFTVKDKDQYTINYLEYYEDKFEGDFYQIQLKPEEKSTAAENQTSTEEAAAEEPTTQAPTSGDEAAQKPSTEASAEQ